MKGVAAPEGAALKFSRKSSSTGIATVDPTGKVTFKKYGTVTVTVTTADSSKKSASVKLTYEPKPVALEIKDSNIRGKNREFQVTVPWTEGVTKPEVTLYDDGKNTSIPQRAGARTLSAEPML